MNFITKDLTELKQCLSQKAVISTELTVSRIYLLLVPCELWGGMLTAAAQPSQVKQISEDLITQSPGAVLKSIPSVCPEARKHPRLKCLPSFMISKPWRCASVGQLGKPPSGSTERGATGQRLGLPWLTSCRAKSKSFYWPFRVLDKSRCMLFPPTTG